MWESLSKKQADIIVVGAGSSGCVIASRLAENPDLKIILIEAGPKDYNPWIHIPIGFSRLLHDKRVNWGYQTVAQPALGGRTINWPRGKVVGGSGAINGMIWVRGDPQDFDEWAEISGDKEWSWDSIQDYFKKCEAAPSTADPRIGRDGRIALTHPRPLNELARAFIEAAETSGLSQKSDISISDIVSVGEYFTTVESGCRRSTANSYLKPALTNKNLTLFTHTFVKAIEFDDHNMATGIRVSRNGQEVSLRAGRGVILCGGAINSPQLLMLSGIGDHNHLADVGISTRVHNSFVGKNLQDHYGARIICKIDEPLTINDDFRRPWRLMKYGLDYLFRRRGPLTIGGAQAGAFLSTKFSGSRPDIQVHFLPLSVRGKGWSFHSFSGITANVCQLRPLSRGCLTLRSSDPNSSPKIDPGYLTEVRDRKVLAEGLRMVRRILHQPPLSSRFGAEEVIPGSDCESEEALSQYAQAHGTTVFHPVGTCKMGQCGNSVVDSKFRVLGVRNLWVADASVIPNLPSGNTNAATTMLAERASEVIANTLKNWKRDSETYF